MNWAVHTVMGNTCVVGVGKRSPDREPLPGGTVAHTNLIECGSRCAFVAILMRLMCSLTGP
jgi:hypothetical protein